MSLFVTGTDTGVGKTQVACALLHRYRQAGYSAVGMKPVAAGCSLVEGRNINEDVAALALASSLALAPELTNPYLFQPAIAPHIAAAEAGVSMDLGHIAACYRARSAQAEHVVVEGAGGFLLPLGEAIDGGDLALALDLPLLLVVGMRLGCLNQALLSAEAIIHRGLNLAGWVANCVTPAMPRLEENIASLQQRIAAPLLGTLPYLPAATPLQLANYLELPAAQSR